LKNRLHFFFFKAEIKKHSKILKLLFFVILSLHTTKNKHEYTLVAWTVLFVIFLLFLYDSLLKSNSNRFLSLE